LINEGRFTIIQDIAVSYQPSGTIERSHNTVTMQSVFAGETYIWVFELVDHNQLKLQLNDSVIPANHDEWNDEMVFALVHKSEDEIDMESLREKYPEYFDLGTFKGLEVYVWQMAPDSYSCGVMFGTNRNKTLEELMNLKGASIAEMRVILSTYDIDENEIFIIPWQNPVSSYMAEYWIQEKDEDQGSVEKRRQEYIEKIRHMLFDTAQNGGYDLPNTIVDIKTAVAYANWTEGEMMRDCLNGDKMIISSFRHLPVYKLDTLEDLNCFKESYKNILTLDQGYDEVPSFEDVTASYDDSFFEGHTIVLAYVTAGSGSCRFDIQEVVSDGSELCLNVIQTNHPEIGTADMAGWFVIAELVNTDLTGITEFDAKLIP